MHCTMCVRTIYFRRVQVPYRHVDEADKQVTSWFTVRYAVKETERRIPPDMAYQWSRTRMGDGRLLKVLSLELSLPKYSYNHYVIAPCSPWL